MQVGQFVEQDFDVTDEKVRAFAEVSGDFNPIHVDDEYAAKSKFGQRIAHGMLTAAFLSAVMAEKLPGPGAAFMKQTMKFVKPVYIGDKIRIRVEVIAYRESRRIVTLAISATRVSNDELTLEGEVLAMVG